MGARTTLILFVIAVLLTGYAVFFERHRVPEWESPGRVFPGLEPSDVTRIELTYLGNDAAERLGLSSESGESSPGESSPGESSSGESSSGESSSGDASVTEAPREKAGADGAEATLVVSRDGEYAWKIERPIETSGLLPRIQGLTWALADLVQIDRLPEGSALEDPRMRIRFWTRQGAEHTVEIGRDYPEASLDYLYIGVDGQDVQVTKKEIHRTFSVSLDDVRDRALFPIAPPDCLRLEVRTGDPASHKLLVRDDGAKPWTFGAPDEWKDTLADRRRTIELGTALNAWTVVSFLSDGASTSESLERFGLAEPRIRVDGLHQNGRTVALDIGREFEERGEKRVYVRFREGGSVFSASTEPLEGLLAGADTLRTEHAFDFEGLRVDTITCRGPKGGYSLVRRAVEAAERERGQVPIGAEWVWDVRPSDGSPSFRADARLVGAAISDLRELLIQSFLAPLESDAERAAFDVSVSLTLENEVVHTLSLGPRSTDPRDADLEMYEAIRTGDRSRFLVESFWPARVEVGPLVFRDRAISTVETHRVFEIEVTAESSKWALFRVPNQGWSLPAWVRQLPDTTLDQKLVNDVLRGLSRDRFRVREFEPGLPKDRYDAWGIGRQNPRQAIALTHIEGHLGGLQRLAVGDLVPDSDPPVYFARPDDPDVAVQIGAGFPRLLARLVQHLREITGE